MTTATATGRMNGRAPVIAHSISSTVELDFDRGTASKTYSPPAWVRMLYRAAFQAPFPYTSNRDAVEAARLRRVIVGRLTTVWFGYDMVSPVVDIHDEDDGSIAFVTRLVEGPAPTDRRQGRAFLRELTGHFLESGLPTWQVTPHNPRAIGNLIEYGTWNYPIIDLESNLVAPLMPVSGIASAIRQGTFPMFDDIDVAKLRTYIVKHEAPIVAALGQDGFAALAQSAEDYAAAAGRWHDAEPRFVSRALRFAFKFVDVASWVRAIRRSTAGSSTMADRLVTQGIDDWAEEGHVTEAQAEDLRAAAKTPEVASALTHLGAHVAMSVPLRFPLGSIARAAWTVAMRLQAEWGALVRGRSAASARQEHTLLVAVASAVPTLGAAAYMLSKPLRSNRAVAVIAFDRLLRKMPWRSYQRFHLSPFMVFHAKVGEQARSARPSATSALRSAGARIAALRPHAATIGAIMAVNAAIVVAGGIVYVGNDSRIVFDEMGVMNTVDALQLAAAGVAGLLAWRAFWQMRANDATIEEAAGIAFWGIAGMGMLYFAADDYFGLHERMGDWMAAHGHMIPLYTNTADDMITLAIGATGLVVLYVFRRELVANRPSSTLLLVGVAAAGLMVATDVYGHGIVRPLEFPAQVTACGMLLLAFVARYREVAPVAEKQQARSLSAGKAAPPFAVKVRAASGARTARPQTCR